MKATLVLPLGLVLVLGGAARPETRVSKEVQALLKDLKSSSAKRRQFAAEELGHIAEIQIKQAKLAIPEVLKVLKDPSPPVRAAAILSLVKMEADPKELVPAYILLLQKDPSLTVRQAAASALGQIGPPARAAVPALKELQAKVQKEQPPKDRKPAKDKTRRFHINQMLLREITMALRSIQAK
jgi:HEAT repeat protein